MRPTRVVGLLAQHLYHSGLHVRIACAVLVLCWRKYMLTFEATSVHLLVLVMYSCRWQHKLPGMPKQPGQHGSFQGPGRTINLCYLDPPRLRHGGPAQLGCV